MQSSCKSRIMHYIYEQYVNSRLFLKTKHCRLKTKTVNTMMPSVGGNCNCNTTNMSAANHEKKLQCSNKILLLNAKKYYKNTKFILQKLNRVKNGK